MIYLFSNVAPHCMGEKPKTRQNLNVAGGFPKEFSEALAAFLRKEALFRVKTRQGRGFLKHFRISYFF
jgi:hypothetical protein